MQHSVTIDGHDLYGEWGLVPTSRLHVAQPEVKTDYVDVPGLDGSLDYSSVLTGDVHYGQRTGSWEFHLKPGESWMKVYSQILNALHGQKVRLILFDDPEYFYQGRVSVNEWRSEEMNSRIVLDYNLDPFKYPLKSTKDIDWLWNDLFDNVIYYGRFDVHGTCVRNLINPSNTEVTPQIICSSNMQLVKDGVSHPLVTGKNNNAGIVLKPGDNVMTFSGEGRVLVDYTFGKSL